MSENEYNDMGNTLYVRDIKYDCADRFTGNIELLQYITKRCGNCFNEIAIIYNKKEMILTFVWSSLNDFYFKGFNGHHIAAGSISDETHEDYHLKLKEIPTKEDLESDLRDGEVLI